MSFHVLIPARMFSQRLPNKPLLDVCGLPMVVRVAKRAALSSAQRVVVATDHTDILQACQAHHIEAVMTDSHHATGSDRLAQACDVLGLPDHATVVNVQGDEPLIEPSLIDACANLLDAAPECVMSTLAHPIDNATDWRNPHVVKVVCNAHHRALFFSRAPIPYWRDPPHVDALPSPAPLRHVGLYAYRVHFLRRFPRLPPSPLELAESLEQLRVLWHAEQIAVHITTHTPGTGVDTPDDLARVRAAIKQAESSQAVFSLGA